MATTSAVDVVMPQMGVSVSEGTITKWLKNVGDTVESDESLLEISTDKVDTEVPSPGSGTVLEILVQEGETVDVGTKLARRQQPRHSRLPTAPTTARPSSRPSSRRSRPSTASIRARFLARAAAAASRRRTSSRSSRAAHRRRLRHPHSPPHPSRRRRNRQPSALHPLPRRSHSPQPRNPARRSSR
jgi:pyruvate/2-oxoglutarate dehydrogenase complex dihydrolipoamide acyltransferase (E2) component